MYWEAVASDTWQPNFRSSPWMRGAPHGLAVAIRLMRVGQPRSLGGPLEDPELVAEGKDLDGQLGAGSEAGKAGKKQGSEEVQHGWAAWSGNAQTSTITHWYGFSGGTGRFRRFHLSAVFCTTSTAAPRTLAMCRRLYVHWSHEQALEGSGALPRWPRCC
jgi:hypothetical protein